VGAAPELKPRLASPGLGDAQRAMCPYGRPMVGQAEELLRRLTLNDETSVRMVLALTPELADPPVEFHAALTPRIRMLVCLAALLAVDASTASLRWAVELASSTGADDDDIVGVLVSVGSDLGLARVVSAAPRLALAIGYDIEVEGWDGS
jgi:4-carboxymuconolactone decarboxylase